ncbi:MAG TPA: formimidoylglutamate deiminase [Steroidobacteraceae bacterium]
MSKLWFESALLPHGWVRGVRITTAATGLIERIEEGTAPGAGDERHVIGVPGIPNVHSHAFQRGLAGLTERRGPAGDSFWTWRELMYRFVERVDPEGVEAIAALVYAEMLEGGFTHVGEFHYLHHDRGGVPFGNPGELAVRIAAAAEQAGIGLTLLPTFYAHGGFGGAEPNTRQRRFINDVDSFARIVEASRKAVSHLPGAAVGIAPHSLRAVTPEELTSIVPLARGEAIHIHIAEQTREVDDCMAWSGRRPIEWLLEAQPVNEQWCLVHATHATDAEVRAMAMSGTIVGLCPITEANLGDGVFPAPLFLRLKGRFGIGSDSNILLDGAEELRILEYSQRLALRARNVLAVEEGQSTGRTLLEGALSGGARALHSVRGSGAAGARTGVLRAGASADIVSLNAQHPALAERSEDEILDSWIFAAGRAVVDCVWRAGVKVVINGRHHRRDALLTRYRHALQELLR